MLESEHKQQEGKSFPADGYVSRERMAEILDGLDADSMQEDRELCESLLRSFAGRKLSGNAERLIARLIDQDKQWAEAYEAILLQRVQDTQ